MIIVLVIAGCGGYNTQPIDASAMSSGSPIKQLADDEGVVQSQIDPVFMTGLVENEFIRQGHYRVILARMSDVMINDLRWFTYAGHQGAAYEPETGKSYSVQWLYVGIDGAPIIDHASGRDVSPFPCDRYIRVFVEGMDEINPNTRVVVGNARGNKFFDLKGNEVPFDPREYAAGQWGSVVKFGTRMADMKPFTYEGESLDGIKANVAGWARTGRYPIEDVSSGKVTTLVTPYQADQGGVNIIHELVKRNDHLSLGDKVIAVSGGITLPISPIPTDYAMSGLSVMIAAIRIPFLEENEKMAEDNVRLISRLREEVNSCSGQKRVVRVPRNVAQQLNGG